MAADVKLGMCVITDMTLEPAPELEALRAAAAAVQSRHPMLQASLQLREGYLYFDFGSPCPVEVRDYSHTANLSSDDAIERELLDPPSGEGCGWRLAVNGPQVLLTYHHSFLDGVSVMQILKEMLLHMDGQPLPQPTSTAARSSPWDRFMSVAGLTQDDLQSIAAQSWRCAEVSQDCNLSRDSCMTAHANVGGSPLRCPLNTDFRKLVAAVFAEDLCAIRAYRGNLDQAHHGLVDSELQSRLTGCTALSVAVAHGKLHSVMVLLAMGADPLQPDSSGVRPLQLAEEMGRLEIAALLRSALMPWPCRIAGTWVPVCSPHREDTCIWDVDGVCTWRHGCFHGWALAVSRCLDTEGHMDEQYLVRWLNHVTKETLFGTITVVHDDCYAIQLGSYDAQGEYAISVEGLMVRAPDSEGASVSQEHAKPLAASASLPVEPQDPPAVGSELPCRWLGCELDGEVCARLKARCREEQTTVTGAIGAAALRAVSRVVKGSLFSLLTAVQAREAYGVPASAVGCYASGIATILRKQDFWQLAREYRARMKASLQGFLHLCAYNEMRDDDPHHVDLEIKRWMAATKPSVFAMREVTISNRGAFSLATPSHHVSKLLTAGQHSISGGMYVSATSVDGTLHLSLSLPKALLGELEATSVAEDMARELKVAASTQGSR